MSCVAYFAIKMGFLRQSYNIGTNESRDVVDVTDGANCKT